VNDVPHPPSEPVHPRDERRTLPVAPSLEATLDAEQLHAPPAAVDGRTVRLCVLAIGLAVAAAFVARALTALIGIVTNLAWYGRLSADFVSPADSPWIWPLRLAIPVAGGIVVGLMARYGSRAIRGHGIPEAMEQVLLNQSRIPPRMTFLKPVSAAVAIGTGGPFGAEGPIIATGGALGSLLGQLLHTTAAERKALLAAGAAAGMAATFGSPVSAVILAIELLLFEYRPRSVIPVALAAATAAGVRIALVGAAPVFPMPALPAPGLAALAIYVAIGALAGLAAVAVTRLVYGVEDAFEKLPIHWMWWPALGGLAVGAVGLAAPHTLGVGYDNIEQLVSGELAGRALLVLVGLKLVSWAIALGSGTSGGTLAPLFTVGGGVGAVLGAAVAAALPGAGVDVRMAALVGMAALFAGASRAVLASVVFAFETTLLPSALLPLLGSCAAAWLVSCLLMRHTIMTEKIARRGVSVPSEYGADMLAGLTVADAARRPVVSLAAADPLAAVRAWIAAGAPDSHHEVFPALDAHGRLVGLVFRPDLFDGREAGERRVVDVVHRDAVVIREDRPLADALALMQRTDVRHLIVVGAADPRTPRGVVTRGDLLAAHERRESQAQLRVRSLSILLAPIRR
jgi:chloride channel protein, CIC family